MTKIYEIGSRNEVEWEQTNDISREKFKVVDTEGEISSNIKDESESLKRIVIKSIKRADVEIEKNVIENTLEEKAKYVEIATKDDIRREREDKSELKNAMITKQTKDKQIITLDNKESEKSNKDCDKLYDANKNLNDDIQVTVNTPKQKINILSDILVYPSTTNDPTTTTKRCRKYMPSVLTFDKWLRLAKEKEKNDSILQKELRKKKREDAMKRKKIIRQEKETNQVKLKKSKPGKSSDLLVTSKQTEKENYFPVQNNNTLPTIDKSNIKLLDFVIVEYENSFFQAE